MRRASLPASVFVFQNYFIFGMAIHSTIYCISHLHTDYPRTVCIATNFFELLLPLVRKCKRYPWCASQIMPPRETISRLLLSQRNKLKRVVPKKIQLCSIKNPKVWNILRSWSVVVRGQQFLFTTILRSTARHNGNHTKQQ
jgi:hypothetical protein